MQFFLFLRSLVFVLLMTVVTIIWAPLCFFAAPFPYRQRYYFTSRWNVFAIWAARVICGIRYQVKGMENMPDGAAVLLSKHQSAWETIFYLGFLQRPLVYVFKKEILYIPFFGWGMAFLRMIPIDRSKRMGALAQIQEQGKKRLADGLSIIMFPEGTRTAVGERGRYKGGGALLAVETKVPVVPIAMNSGECWPKTSFIKKPGLITVSIGPPIMPEDLSANEVMQKVENWIESEMRVISPHAYSATSDTPIKTAA